MEAPSISAGVSIDLRPYKLRTHVDEALRIAVSRSGGKPISAGMLLDSALSLKGGRGSDAFAWLASLFPPDGSGFHENEKPDTAVAVPEVLTVEDALAASFEAAQPFLSRDGEIWGRDYITIALLSDESSLEEFVNNRSLSVQFLRDEWFRFVTTDPKNRNHRPWTEWWNARGIPVPGESPNPASPNGNLPEAFQKTSHGIVDANIWNVGKKGLEVAEGPATNAEDPAGLKTEPAPEKKPEQPARPAANDEVIEQGTQSGIEAKQEAAAQQETAARPARQADGVPARFRAPDTWMLSDLPLDRTSFDQDQFHFRDYADALSAIMDHEKTETPFTMAINAPWGAGKTSLANMIAEQLQNRPRDRGEKPHVICWFNAWMHDDAPNLATAFVAQVARTANTQRSWVTRVFDPLPSGLLTPSQRKWRRVGLGSVIVCLTLWLSVWLGSHLEALQEKQRTAPQAITKSTTTDGNGKVVSTTSTYPLPPAREAAPHTIDAFLEIFQSRLVVLGTFFTALTGLLGLLARLAATTSLSGFVTSPDRAAETGAIQAAATQLQKLIGQATWRGNRFIVFVDDIERCTPPRSIDILDAVNQLMGRANVVVVFLGDMSAVAASAQLKYKDVAEIFVPSTGVAVSGPDRGKEAFGRLYLQKIIQLQFDLPIPPKEMILDYMRQLAVTAPGKGGQ